MIHSYLPSIPMQFIFQTSKEKKKEEKKNKWAIRKFSPLLTQPRGSNFFHARYKKKKEKGRNIKASDADSSNATQKNDCVFRFVERPSVVSPVIATYNFAYEWATTISRAQKKILCKRGGRHHVLTRVPAWWTLVRGHQFLTVVHPVSNTTALHVCSHSEWSCLIFITWKSSLFSNFFW